MMMVMWTLHLASVLRRRTWGDVLTETEVIEATQYYLHHEEDKPAKLLEQYTMHIISKSKWLTGGVETMSSTRCISWRLLRRSLVSTAPTITMFRVDFTTGITLGVYAFQRYPCAGCGI